jgi:hypothetical protein
MYVEPMHETVATTIEAWANFYVIVGSSAGALTGLQFVVLTIIAQIGSARGETISAFGTPTVVHFCAALLVAAILSAPWREFLQAGVPVAVCGAAGVIYSAIVLQRARRQEGYEPVLEDWVWHAILPMLAYASMMVAGVVFPWIPVGALFVVGGATLLLVFIGIHNAWDSVMYVTIELAAGRLPGGMDARTTVNTRADVAPASGSTPVTGIGAPATTPGPPASPEAARGVERPR